MSPSTSVPQLWPSGATVLHVLDVSQLQHRLIYSFAQDFGTKLHTTLFFTTENTGRCHQQTDLVFPLFLHLASISVTHLIAAMWAVNRHVHEHRKNTRYSSDNLPQLVLNFLLHYSLLRWESRSDPVSLNFIFLYLPVFFKVFSWFRMCLYFSIFKFYHIWNIQLFVQFSLKWTEKASNPSKTFSSFQLNHFSKLSALTV